MTTPTHCAVVAHDPFGALPEGEIVHGQEIQRLQTRGVTLVLADHELATSPTACGQGYVRRAFGQGVKFDSFIGRAGPQLLAPLALRAVPGPNYLQWAAEVVIDDPANLQGSFRLTCPPVLVSGQPPSMRTLALPELVELKGHPKHARAILTGEGLVDVDQAIYLPLCLSGVGQGVTVRWLAVGQRTIA